MATVTAESTAVIPESEDSADFFEIIDGQRVELPPMGAHEIWLAARLFSAIDRWAEAHQAGQVVPEMLFDLRPVVNRKRRPDLAFVSFGRWPKDRPVPRMNAWAVVPDLAVEIVSPTDLAIEVLAKVREYLRAGVRLVWVIYPDQTEVHVFDPESAGTIRVLPRGDDLDGGAVLPGFRLPLASLFGAAPPPTEEPGAGG